MLTPSPLSFYVPKAAIFHAACTGRFLCLPVVASQPKIVLDDKRLKSWYSLLLFSLEIFIQVCKCVIEKALLLFCLLAYHLPGSIRLTSSHLKRIQITTALDCYWLVLLSPEWKIAPITGFPPLTWKAKWLLCLSLEVVFLKNRPTYLLWIWILLPLLFCFLKSGLYLLKLSMVEN